MNAREQALLNDFQRDFPLCEAPYAAIARALRWSEREVLATLRCLVAEGIVGRVGAVFRPGSVGASTLAAMAVPPARLADVARRVSAHDGVNHNYEREHRFNLWFVANARDERALQALLARIEREAVLPVIALPLRREFHIDLGFDLAGGAAGRTKIATTAPIGPLALDARSARLVAALEEGLPLSPRPYRVLAERAGFDGATGESDVLATLRRWLREGHLKRLGVVVRHRPLGFVANAMAVWDVPDADVEAAGAALACEPRVTLCYARARALPAWPYNLFCMVHGRDRADVEAALDAIGDRAGLGVYPHARLFSGAAFKQTGARHFVNDVHYARGPARAALDEDARNATLPGEMTIDG
jgi:DNA-binding Lrp family transcriptional regulator